jgi:hypothetical protein
MCADTRAIRGERLAVCAETRAPVPNARLARTQAPASLSLIALTARRRQRPRQPAQRPHRRALTARRRQRPRQPAQRPHRRALTAPRRQRTGGPLDYD